MKSVIRNGLDGPIQLGPLGITPGGIVLEPGASAVVDQDPALVSLLAGLLAQHLHVSEASDSEATSPPSVRSYIVRASGSFDASGNPSGSGFTVSHPSVGQYRVTLAAALPSVDPRLVRVSAHAEQSNGPANAVGSILDASTVAIGVTADHGGPVDAACRWAVLDFT